MRLLSLLFKDSGSEVVVLAIQGLKQRGVVLAIQGLRQ